MTTDDTPDRRQRPRRQSAPRGPFPDFIALGEAAQALWQRRDFWRGYLGRQHEGPDVLRRMTAEALALPPEQAAGVVEAAIVVANWNQPLRRHDVRAPVLALGLDRARTVTCADPYSGAELALRRCEATPLADPERRHGC